MKTYQSQPNDSFAGIAKKFKIKDENFLKTFHNLNCPQSKTIKDEIPVGTTLLIPEDPQFFNDENQNIDEEINTMNNESGSESDPGEDTMDEESEQASSTDEDSKEEEKKEQNSESNSSEHDGKYFVIPRGKAICDKGTQFPGFKVTSHQKHYWNDENGEPDYLAVTEGDVMFNPAATPFGNCSVKNGNPCAFAPSGKWTKTYDKVKIMDKCCVTELSELMCSTGGKITVLKHGQQSELGKSNVNNADPKEQHVYNPVVDFEEFKEEINGDDPFEVE